MKIESVEVSGLDDVAAPLALEVTFAVEGFATRQRNGLSSALPLLFAPRENPLAEESRTLPVEFPYRSTWREEVHLDLPAGYYISGDLPEVGRRIPEVGFTLHPASEEGGLKATCELAVRECTVEDRRYAQVRRFYDEVLESANASFPLRRGAVRGSR